MCKSGLHFPVSPTYGRHDPSCQPPDRSPPGMYRHGHFLHVSSRSVVGVVVAVDVPVLVAVTVVGTVVVVVVVVVCVDVVHEPHSAGQRAFMD